MPAAGSGGSGVLRLLKRLERDEKGFTLVELLVVLAVLGLLLGVVFSFFLFGTKVYHGGADQAHVQHQLRYAAEYITREVRFANNLRVFSHPPEEVLGDFNYLYLGGEDNHVLVHQDARGSRIIAEAVFTDLAFTVVRADDAGAGSTFQYKLVLEISAVSGERSYGMESAVLLPNCTDFADEPEAFPVLRYQKPK